MIEVDVLGDNLALFLMKNLVKVGKLYEIY